MLQQGVNSKVTQVNILLTVQKMSVVSSPRTSLATHQSASNIHELVDRFEKISSSIHLELGKNSLQGMENDSKGSRYHGDPHTKLKNIENKSEMNRAEVQLLSLRKPKRYSYRMDKQKQEQNRQSYQSIYNKLKQQQPFLDFTETDYNEQEENNDTTEISMPVPNNIRHLNHLKNHPKLLQYTLYKLEGKNLERKEDLHREEVREEMKRASMQIEDYRDMIEDTKRQFRGSVQTSKLLIDNQLTKFYSKNTKGQLDGKIRENPRCFKMLERQKRIMSNAGENPLSKQNVKKLKQRLNEIVNELSKSDRKSLQKLPKISKSTPKTPSPMHDSEFL